MRNKMIYQIRKATLKDVEQIYNLGARAQEFFVGETSGGFWSKRQLSNWVKSKDDICLVVVIKNQVAGFILSAYHKPTNKVTIENVFVIEKFRKKGIGKKMITDLLNLAVNHHVKQGAVYIMTLTRKRDRAYINLMKKLGFVIGYRDWVWIEKEFTEEFPKRKR